MKNPVSLCKARPEPEPAAFFTELARVSKLLNIDRFDVYGDFNLGPDRSPLRRFEAEVATYLGKEDAMFLPSGIMAQNIVLGISKEDSASNKFVCHFSSHLLLHENEAYSTLMGMEPVVVDGDFKFIAQKPMTYDQVAPLIGSGDSKVAAVVLELPHRELGGKCTEFEDIVKMSEHCKREGVRFHMDGARLWEATAAYNRSAAELASHFDSVYVSFYKGLNGMSGAMLLGDAIFVERCRTWMRRLGGNLYTQAPVYISAWAGFRENKDTFAAKKKRLDDVVRLLKRQLLSKPSINSVADEVLNAEDRTFFSEDHSFTPMIRFDPPKPEVPLIRIVINADMETVKQANELAAKHSGITCFSRFVPGSHGSTGLTVSELNMVSSFF